MSTMVAPRHALGWPAGSVRALLTLMVVGLVCALMFLPPHDAAKPTPIPAYLLYLMFLVLGHYFAARGNVRGQDDAIRHPLWLPRGAIRLLLLVGLSATLIYRYTTHPDAFLAQWKASVMALEEVPLLPVVILTGFFLGAVLRMLIGQSTAAWWQDFEAWTALIAVILLSVATMIQLVINPSMTTELHLPILESITSGVVAFYFGERS